MSRQALAMVDHMNIAKVLDAGTTEIGMSLDRSTHYMMRLNPGYPQALEGWSDQFVPGTLRTLRVLEKEAESALAGGTDPAE